MYNLDYDTTILAKIWNTLNHWKWADELGDKPDGWDEMYNHIPNDLTTTTKYKISSPIMHKIEDMIGVKECLRWHNVQNGSFTNEEFEQWWRGEHKEVFIV